MAQTPARYTIDPALERFARKLQTDIGASRVLLFGSHAEGYARPDSDYDLIIVSEHFAGVHPLERTIGLRPMFYEVGGNAPMDLICLTPQEFSDAQERVTLVAAVTPHAIDLLEPDDK